MKKLIVPLLAGCLFLLSCDDDDDLCLTGSGTVAEYELSLSSFDQIGLKGPVNLRFRQGPVQKVVVYAEPELFGPMEYRVRNGTLEIGYENNVRCFNTNFGVWIDVTVPELTDIALSGQGIIETDMPIEQDIITIVVSGQAEINLEGEVIDQNLIISGEADASNFDLASENTRIVISGSAELDVACSEFLDIELSGSAVIRYLGFPQIDQKVSGSLELINAN